MNLAVWIVTGVLATGLFASTSKMFVPREKMAALGCGAEWVMDFSPGALRAISILELLAVAGLILPAVLDIAPIMVPVTATCVALLFVCAGIMRFRRGERVTILGDVFYFAMAVFVATGRFWLAPFTG